MNYCPYCMRPADGKFCPNCGKNTGWEASSSQLPAGTILSGGSSRRQYVTGAVLGQGGFGITYIALDLKSGKRSAVKECFPSQSVQRKGDHLTVEPKSGAEGIFEKIRSRFVMEAELLSKQAHLPSVVKIFDCFQANNTAYFVMEYLNGETLQQKMKREGKFSARILLAKLKPFMEDLGKMHSSGIIHRDIAPDNIMWMPDGRLVLMDFGNARTMGVNKEMSVLLKHEFAPIEQYQKKGQGPWTDIYALCATVYYCLTGNTPPQAVERLEKETLIPLRNLGVDVSKEQDEAICWGLAVQPSMRPQNIAAFMKKLYAESAAPQSASKTAPSAVTQVSEQAVQQPVLPREFQTGSEAKKVQAGSQKNKTAALVISLIFMILIFILFIIYLVKLF